MTFALKPTHRAVKAYYEQLATLGSMGIRGEGAVAPAFANLLRAAAGNYHWTVAEQFSLHTTRGIIRTDGALLDEFKLLHGIWEAKDTDDDLAVEVRRKFDSGYPRDNILFQAPDQVILVQNGREVLNSAIREPKTLLQALAMFFEYQPPAIDQWQRAVEVFKESVPQLGSQLKELIERAKVENPRFKTAFATFYQTCREVINPNLSVDAVEEMLIQHILTERLFRKVFANPDFVQRNVIAREIETVFQALTSQSFSREEFMRPLDHFYGAIEQTAESLSDFSQKQQFLNAVYEKFFQGFSVKAADVYGIVYTPLPVVDFMVRSVQSILKREFGRGLEDEGVHILDPFVGTGTFIVQAMRHMPRASLERKFASELHCNEIMLMPYYIASQNIEHTYYELTRQYLPFEGICLVDTFEDVRGEGGQYSITFGAENTERVRQQRRAPIYVIMANPPYNAKQVNINDKNKNRKYPGVDGRVYQTYVRTSHSKNKTALSDVYVKAFRWASDRIGKEGIIAFITNSGFLDGIAFDGMRKILLDEFDQVFIVDLGGNVRANPKLSGTTHNVFGIQVGVCITILVKLPPDRQQRPGKLLYAKTGEYWRKEQKYSYLDKAKDIFHLGLTETLPDTRYTWLTKGMEDDFSTFLPIGSKQEKGKGKAISIFRDFSNGIQTNRDAWVYAFQAEALHQRIKRMIVFYNNTLHTWIEEKPPRSAEEFIPIDEQSISWSGTLKERFKQKVFLSFDEHFIESVYYRPFCKPFLYKDPMLIHRRAHWPIIFPTPESKTKNKVICINGSGMAKTFYSLIVNAIADVQFTPNGQCFPFYTYKEDGSERKENIPDETLALFQTHYADGTISKWDIFHYVYGLLHSPEYRTRYAANLRRDLPRLPFAPDFWTFVRAGAKLADLHVGYEDAAEYPLEKVESPSAPVSWRVEKMRLMPDLSIRYNDFLTLRGVPAKALEYKLGSRSALGWIIEEYRVTVDPRSGIRNDPNRADDPKYIFRLLGKIITVSLETMAVVEGLPGLG